MSLYRTACQSAIRTAKISNTRFLYSVTSYSFTQSSRFVSTMLNTPLRPSKIVCIGRNYADHVAELKSETPKKPFFFLKPPSSILTGGAALECPRGVETHYEVELALIIGRTLRDHPASDEQGALDAVKAYALAIDMTARNVQFEAKRKGLPWDIAKGFDGFLPLSQVIPKERLPNPHEVELWLNVNGEVKQKESTNLMLFRIPAILSEISQVMTLEKDDIVLTGTPKGVGPVVPGDVMEAGLRVDGKDIEESKIKVPVKESSRVYQYSET